MRSGIAKSIPRVLNEPVRVQDGLKPGDQIIATALDFSAAMAGQGK